MVFFVLLAAASAYALLIGMLYIGQTVQTIPVAVCDLDQSALSRQLVRDVASADTYHFVGTTASEAEGEQWLAAQKAAAVVVIPPDFAKKFYQGEDVTLGFLQDGANTLEASYASAPMQLIWTDWMGRYRAEAIVLPGTPQVQPGAVGLSLRYTGNPTQSYLVFYVYGVMLIAAQIGITMSYGLAVQGDSRHGYYRRHGLFRVMAVKISLY
jgi:ABC-2 type transport system permease protein